MKTITKDTFKTTAYEGEYIHSHSENHYDGDKLIDCVEVVKWKQFQFKSIGSAKIFIAVYLKLKNKSE